MKSALQIGGEALLQVVDHKGNVVHSHRQKNLILDSGMERIATDVIANLFTSCARGTGTTDTKEIVTGTYSQASNTVTRVTGARDFSVGDEGKRIKFAGGETARITLYVSPTQVSVAEAQTVGSSSIIIYATDQTALATETHRTSTYSAASGDNGTTDASNVRTMKRTFIFDPETGSPVSVSDLYSKAGNVVTRDAGIARDFTADDEGSYISFDDTGGEYLITSYTSADEVVVDDSGDTITSSPIKIYGFNEYSEIGFSHAPTAGSNINIRIKLASPIPVQIPTSILPGQQLRVVYEMAVTLTPATSTAGDAPITDAGNLLSANPKPGDFAIESMALSSVNADGSTNYDNAGLEPSQAGYIGLSDSFAALVPFNGPDRTSGAGFVQAANQAYTALSFTRRVTGSFGVNDAIGSARRSLLLSSAITGRAGYVFLFDTNQNKASSVALTVVFKKTWGRTLA